jgi:hypothetical protein
MSFVNYLRPWFDQPVINGSGKGRIKAKHLSAKSGAARCWNRNQPPDWGMKFMASGNDMKSANETYSGFMSMLKWGPIVSAIITAAVVVIIA